MGNLSPDSTLRALQATETIPGGAAQDALTSSIGDATPAEREVGIRAAFAAQKLRGWIDELSRWTWPVQRERSLGLGFIPPPAAKGTGTEYRGFLTVAVADQYQARLEEIKNNLDSLDIDEIKDHVLEAHVPAQAPPRSPITMGIRTSYGRMRDFTALITATVIQALPDLAKLNILFNLWDVRLRVLKELSPFLQLMASTESAIQQAFKDNTTPELAQEITETAYEGRKVTLGGHVSDIGRRVDRLLDMLEGYEDSLPQAWIDQLEKIELDYATWVVEAQHVVLRNELALARAARERLEAENSVPLAQIEEGVASGPSKKGVYVQTLEAAQTNELVQTLVDIPKDQPVKTHDAAQPPDAELPAPNNDATIAKRKPSLKLDLTGSKGHRREVSKVSVADSMYSTFSDLSNAEIMDATATSVLPSPKVSVVDNPFRSSRDEITWFGNSSAAQQQMAAKPPMLQRASTALIEVIPKDQLKQVTLRRTVSWDMLSEMPQSPESTPSRALKQLTGSESPQKKRPTDDPEAAPPPEALSTDATPLASPSLLVQPLRVRTGEPDSDAPRLPALPRRSSKRNTRIDSSTSSPLTPTSSASSAVVSSGNPSRMPSTIATESFDTPPRAGESLDDKIQDLLTTLPTKIRLAKDTDSSSSVQPSSRSSTRSSTPTPALTLSPVKPEPTSRKGSAGDSEIRVYHLTRTGQARDLPPVKLFVRTIGDGHRVMVRVGGGWADLGEYLREYSLHHGSRTAVDGRLEVASFPSNGQKESGSSVNGNAAAGSQGRRKPRSPSATQTGFETNSSPELINPRVRPSLARARSPEPGRKGSRGEGAWTPPPVPRIPASFTSRSPTITTTTNADEGIVTGFTDPDALLPTASLSTLLGDGEMPFNSRTTTYTAPGISTTTVVSSPVVTTNYTPLGAAGPKTNTRRAATYGTAPTVNNDAWVEGMVGKARVVSGGSPTLVQGPTTTTTTMVTSTTPTSRRASSYLSSSPTSISRSMTASPSPSNASGISDTKSRHSSLTGRPKSRMSLSDIGGIKRVFLRKKSENAR